ncbi:MAG: methyltransferase [Turicibacter sp.]|nr:methyltransferase [Turicibacter sp.]
MGHYFSKEEPLESNPQTFEYDFSGNRYIFTTDIGVFSRGKMDGATEILLENLPPLQGSLLDLGCGYGAIGIILAKQHNITVTQSDINPRAVSLARLNAEQNGVVCDTILSDGFEKIAEKFDNIIINPPIHAGKEIIFALYKDSHSHLKAMGKLFVVIQKKHGANSNIAFLSKLFGNCKTLHKRKGLFVLKCLNTHPTM